MISSSSSLQRVGLGAQRRPTLSLAAPMPRRPLHSAGRTLPQRVVPAAVGLPTEYGYVIASTAFTAAVLQWQAVRVVMARKKYGVEYPQMYADGKGEDATAFNCTQRAHQNSLEIAPAMTIMACMLGLVHPVTAAALSAVWAVARIFYALGYANGGPKGRLPGAAVSGLAYLGTIITTLVVGLRVAFA